MPHHSPGKQCTQENEMINAAKKYNVKFSIFTIKLCSCLVRECAPSRVVDEPDIPGLSTSSRPYPSRTSCRSSREEKFYYKPRRHRFRQKHTVSPRRKGGIPSLQTVMGTTLSSRDLEEVTLPDRTVQALQPRS